ncbi:hypothetical protein AVEN_136034-1 [Araneus ventricosus]|uniref:Uncharacterized protein n=1 Tax=Araneus ventricosus TaxID=182803 RepID=A0A4Y2EWS3_ARAVE|nr:hypothetical protein AVEN_136034-1 [Araneus ventricosus]
MQCIALSLRAVRSLHQNLPIDLGLDAVCSEKTPKQNQKISITHMALSSPYAQETIHPMQVKYVVSAKSLLIGVDDSTTYTERPKY